MGCYWLVITLPTNNTPEDRRTYKKEVLEFGQIVTIT